MSPPSSKFPSAAAACLLVLAACATSSRAWAQACCAGGSAVTPARLELHEDFLAGVELHAGDVLGSYDVGGHAIREPAGTSELDFEQDLFGAARVFRRGQVALLVPFIETRRSVPPLQGGTHLGGGIGDITLSGRYDFIGAGESLYVPGIAVLAGVTAPTGISPEQATQPLAVDATGTGTWQINGALAFEQTYGPWLLNATGILAVRTPSDGEMLAPQVTLLAATAYTFPNDAALAVSVSYAFEGEATSGGAPVPDSAKRLTTVTVSGLYPVTDAWRLLGGLFLEPPVSQLGSNQPASAGLTLTVIRSWS
jgi:hypothetical protein